jgi:intein/homing endonuclease
MGGGCLVAGTKIQTVKGSVPIEYIQVGDKVRTMFGYSYVTDTFCFNDKEVFEMELEDGEIVKCSADHKFLVDTEKGYEWKKVIDLLPGDTIKCIPTISI